jgi:DNA repair protein RadC
MANTYKFKSRTFSIACEKPEETYCGSPRLVGPILLSLYRELELDECYEHFVVLVLNSKGKIVGHKVLSSGTATACLVTPAMVFQAALILGGIFVLVCHNHPGGDTTPSREDLVLTKRMRTAGEVLGVPLADHIILGHDTFLSLRNHERWDTTGDVNDSD